MGLLTKVFGSDNSRNIAKLEKIAKKVEDLDEKYRSYTDDQLRACTEDFKERIKNGEKLIDILPEAYAVVREASGRVMGMRHFHVQILGGIALFQGRIAEMRTGEGKTLTETLPAYLMALEGKGVHIVTVNEYLSARDAEWMGKIFKFLGLTVGISTHAMDANQKREAYNCDITYSTNNELGFDYLRDNLIVSPEQRVARGYHFAIVDEVDSILIDEARTPLIISGKGMKSSELYKSANRFAKSLRKDDYEIDEKEKAIRLTEHGITKAERFFNIDNLSDIENIEINHHIKNALTANYIQKLDQDYIVKDGEVIIVDEFTGRLMEGRKYSNGLHQAIEAKEGLQVRDESKTIATITFQNFFRLYHKLSGMTGTAKTEEREFNKIYNLDVVTIPTNLPIRRKDAPDVIYVTEKAKMDAIVEEVKRVHETGRPILVGTINIDKSEQISAALKRAKIKHNVLNAKNHLRESEIIAQAGRLNAVTIATNMAGRGTDIMLGGNAEYLAKQELRNKGYNEAQIDFCTSLLPTDNPELIKIRDEYKQLYKGFKETTDKEKEQVITLGGLHILGTERHDSRRIDNQLRGRSGRQGDPGSSVFFVSMEDDLMRRFGGERMQGIVRFFKIEEDTPFQIKMLSRQIEKAQQRVENFNYGMRHTVLLFDDVINQQRMLIYGERNRVIDGDDIHDEIVDMIREYAKNAIYESVDENKSYDEWDLDALNERLNTNVLPNANYLTEDIVEGLDIDELAVIVADEAVRMYENKCAEISKFNINYLAIERNILLKVVDTMWVDQVDFLEILRSEIMLRQYGNQDPVLAFKKESFDAFERMSNEIRKETAMFVINYRLNIEIKQQQKEKKPDLITNMTGVEKTAKTNKIVGRNDLCPCGSGKKYKNCCMVK